MSFPETILPITVEIQLGALGWVDISSDVYSREPIVITRGRSDEASATEPARCTLQINNRQGQFSPRRPASPYFGLLGRNTPIRVSVVTNSGTRSYRFTGEVAEWPPRWSEAELDAWVPIEAAGILRRLGQSTPPLHDALRRRIEQGAPLQYWPMTEPESALLATDVASGGMAFRNSSFFASQAEFGKGTIAPWLASVLQTPSDSGGNVYAAPTRRYSGQSYSVDWCYLGGVAGTRGRHTMNLNDDGDKSSDSPWTTWKVGISPQEQNVTVSINTIPGGSLTTISTTTPRIHDGFPHHIRLTLTADGSSTDWELWIDGESAASGTRAVVLRPLAQIIWQWDLKTGLSTDPEEVTEIAFGHVVFWGADPPAALDIYRAMRGWEQERAGRRIERLCAEQGIPLRVTGSLDDTPEMGPQKAGSLLEVLRSAEDVDGGVLGEARDELALAYRTNASRYNQGVSTS